MTDATESRSIEALVARLSESFPAIAPDRIAAVVSGEHARFDGRPLREYVPLFVERGAVRALRMFNA